MILLVAMLLTQTPAPMPPEPAPAKIEVERLLVEGFACIRLDPKKPSKLTCALMKDFLKALLGSPEKAKEL